MLVMDWHQYNSHSKGGHWHSKRFPHKTTSLNGWTPFWRLASRPTASSTKKTVLQLIFLQLGFLCFARIMGMPPKLRVSLSRWIDRLHGDFRPKDETAMKNAFFTKVISSPGPRRRFCVTERGLFGLFPAGCQPGDDVFILKGGAVPFVLRPVGIPSSGGTDEQTYRLIGDAYIRGIMYGEALSFDGIRELNAHII